MPTQPMIRCAVVGNPIAHSRSPEIHHAFAKQINLPLEYSKMLADPNDFSDHVRGFFAQGGKGLNITVPFKENAFAMVQQLSPTARAAGAVNTLWMENNQLHGCNTDGLGLVLDLRRLDFDPEGKRILLIGAGGAAKGVLLPLLEAGAAHIHVINRTLTKAQELRAQFPTYRNTLSASSWDALNGDWDIVINATSSSLSGLHPLPENIQSSLVFNADRALAYDMVYGDEPTVFMQRSQEQGASHSADGLGMLVGQAARSFAIWHGKEPEISPVLAALKSY